MTDKNPPIPIIDAHPDMGYFIFCADGKRHSPRQSWYKESSFYETYDEARNAASTPSGGRRFSLIYGAFEIWAFFVGKDVASREFFPPFCVYTHFPKKVKP